MKSLEVTSVQLLHDCIALIIAANFIKEVSVILNYTETD